MLRVCLQIIHQSVHLLFYAHEHTHTHTHTQKHTYTCTYTGMRLRVYTCTYIHVCTHNPVANLDFNVAHFGSGSDDGPAHQRWEDVRREVGSSVSALHELEMGERHAHRYAKITTLSSQIECIVSFTDALPQTQGARVIQQFQLTPVPLSHTMTLFPLQSVITILAGL